MKITLNINQKGIKLKVNPGDRLLDVLRDLGYLGAKSGGCVRGECGACTVLLDGRSVNSCMLLAAQAEGHLIETIEAQGQHPDQGWKKTTGLDPIQQAFVETGAIQCGYCTPAMVLNAKALLRDNPKPSEEEVRNALSGVLCRCTGYVKPVQAVLRAGAIMRGEPVPAIDKKPQASEEWIPEFGDKSRLSGREDDKDLILSGILPRLRPTPESKGMHTVGHPEIKVDAMKLVQGKPAFTADITKPDMLIAKVLHSPVAHANIKRIDVSKARALPGVAAVLTWEDIPRVVYSTAGQSDPIPGPLDMFSLDKKVRFVGDRVAIVAAETAEIAEYALQLIEVDYEELPVIIDPRDAMKEGAPQIHDEPEFVNFAASDASKNLAAEIRIDIGDVEKGFEEADRIFEEEYLVPKVQLAHIEPHVVITYWDADDRLVIRTSTQVPFHVRRIIAPVIGLPVKRIRVIKPRIGGAFGGKQEVLIEDVAAHLTIATGRPVLYEMTREEEFIASRSRHPMRIKLKTGVKNMDAML